MNTTSNDISDLFNLVSSISVSIIAIIGNSIVLFILTKQEFFKETFYRYLLIGTIFNTISALLIWPNNYPDLFLINEILISCQLYQYINDVSTTFSAWIIALCSVDTFLSVKYPTKFKFVKSFKAQIIIILSLSVLFCSLYSTDWIYLVINPEFGCLVVKAKTAFYLNIILGCSSIIFPFLLMLITNILTYLQLLKKSQINRNNVKRANNLFRISVGFNLLFLISSIPGFIVYLVANLANDVFISTSPFFFQFFNLLSYCFYSIDFFVYLIANRRFRESFFVMIKIFPFWKKNPENEVVGMNTGFIKRMKRSRNRVANSQII